MDMDRNHPATYPATPTLRAMLEAAQGFGLTPEQAWRTLNAALARPRFESTVAEYLDEIAGALAQEILAKERRTLDEPLP